MKITLLTHFKELNKRSNTGQVVLEVLGSDARQLRWDRMNPPDGLVEEINKGGVALVYPGAADETDSSLDDISHIILIDGTWHEARKVYQRSTYLQQVRRICLKPTGKSRYSLRKNQKEGCLCTAECVIEVLRGIGDNDKADQLEERFLAFISRSGAKQAVSQQ